MHAISVVTITVIISAMVTTLAATAATPLSELRGQWSGQGTDRDSLFGSSQGTRCRATMRTDGTHLTNIVQW